MADLVPPPLQSVRQPIRHDSAATHVSGTARYVDDMPEAADLLHLAFGLSSRAHARIVSMDLSAVRRFPGVVAVLTADDIPGDNNVSPVAHDDVLLAEGEVNCVGPPCRAARRGRV